MRSTSPSSLSRPNLRSILASSSSTTPAPTSFPLESSFNLNQMIESSSILSRLKKKPTVFDRLQPKQAEQEVPLVIK